MTILVLILALALAAGIAWSHRALKTQHAWLDDVIALVKEGDSA